METLTEFHSKGELLALPQNIRLRWKRFVVKNTLAYNTALMISTVLGRVGSLLTLLLYKGIRYSSKRLYGTHPRRRLSKHREGHNEFRTVTNT